jgi:hypothetical protein
MATINYSFTISGSSGSQSVQLLKQDNTVIATEAKAHADGNISGTLTVSDNLLTTTDTYKVKITDGGAVEESSLFTALCSFSYDLDTPGDANAATACSNTGTNVVIYASTTDTNSVTKFFSDDTLITPYNGGAISFRFQRQGEGGSVSGTIAIAGDVTSIANC